MSILHIKSSASPAMSNSTLLGTEVAAKLGGTVTTRNTNDGLPQIAPDWVAANFTPADDRTAEQAEMLSLSDTLIEELKAADTLILSAPMYNFAVPATLKSWIDHICRAGVTFQYSETGPKGLMTGKRAVIVVTTGGTPADSEADFVTSYLRHILGFIGITDVSVIAADRILVESDQAIAAAREAIAAL